MPRVPKQMIKSRYEALAAWRHALRKFLHFSQEAARTAGLPPQQHQALLTIKGARGRDFVTVGELAEQLLLRHHSTVELIDRLVERQLVRRDISATDRRRVEVRLTRRGEALIEELSAVHLRELREMGPELKRLLEDIGRE